MSHASQTKQAPEFTGLRAIFWPIHKYELKKFIPMALMMSFVLFNYSLLRNIKDVLIVKQIGGAAISYVKLIGTMPMAILFVLIYTKLSSVLSKQKLFYVSLLPFVIYFALFGFVLYPNLDALQPSEQTINKIVAQVPSLEFVFRVCGKWVLSLFYVFSELWGSVVLSLLFWQFANDITRVKEAKRFYPLFGMCANVGLISSGYALVYFADQVKLYKNVVEGWAQNLQHMMLVVTIVGFAIPLIYHWMQKRVLSDPMLYDPAEKVPKKKKVKLGLGDSFKLVFSSKYIGLIAALVLCYGIAQNLIEVSWKNQLGHFHTGQHELAKFFGENSILTGYVVIAFMFIGSNIVRLFGWKFSATATPIMIAVTGFFFFGSVLFNNTTWMNSILGILSLTPIALAVYVGQAQVILSKATKYSLFDATKEMSYIPLSEDLRVKGKAAVDVVGGRLGKSGGSVIQAVLIGIVGVGTADPQLAIMPYLFAFVVVTAIVWLYAIGSLSGLFDKANKEKEKEIADMEADASKKELAVSKA